MKNIYKIAITMVICAIIIAVSIYAHYTIENSVEIINATVKSIL